MMLRLFRVGLGASRWKLVSRWLPTVPIDLPRIQATQGACFARVRIVPNGLSFKWDKSLCFVAPLSAYGCARLTFCNWTPLNVQF